MPFIKLSLIFALLLSTSGCGLVFRSSSVTSGLDDGSNVNIVSLTAQSLGQANATPYSPRSLPAALRVAPSGSSTPRGIGALPAATAEPQAKPGRLELRVPPAANPGPYRIGVSDVVLLSTPSSGSTIDELSGLLAAQNSRQGYTVQDDGTINIPNVGRVPIANRTIEEAEDLLFERLVESQIEPTFSLEIAEFNARRVSVGGAVAKPSIVSVKLTPLYISEALASAGGVTVEDQDFASVRLYRNGNLYQIPLTELYSSPQLLRTRLIDGDALFVDTEYQLDQANEYFEQQLTLINARQNARNAALGELQAEIAIRRAQLEEARVGQEIRKEFGADNRDYVYVTGEVRRQSRFALPYEAQASLADALYGETQGFIPETADISQIYVLRGDQTGANITAWHVDARNAASYVVMTRFELRPSDVIFVAQQPITRWNRALSQLLPTLVSAAQDAQTF